MARDITPRTNIPHYKEHYGKLVEAGHLVAGCPQKVGEDPMDMVLGKGKVKKMVPILDENGHLPKSPLKRRYISADVLE